MCSRVFFFTLAKDFETLKPCSSLGIDACDGKIGEKDIFCWLAHLSILCLIVFVFVEIVTTPSERRLIVLSSISKCVFVPSRILVFKIREFKIHILEIFSFKLDIKSFSQWKLAHLWLLKVCCGKQESITVEHEVRLWSPTSIEYFFYIKTFCPMLPASH